VIHQNSISRLYSIPEPQAIECLVETECVCGLEAVGESEEVVVVTVDDLKAEVPMDKQKSGVFDVVVGWLKEQSFLLVLGMSLFHVGLAYIHTRDSGRGD
jgi:hypothetical protein